MLREIDIRPGRMETDVELWFVSFCAGLMDGYGDWEHAVVYEDGDGDWMLVGDVPWE
jgi:auxin-responsive protein IAA